jgi:hypothetical protein
VSSLGHERVPFVLRDGDWVAVEGFAPLLTAVVGALEQRRAALERGQIAGLCGEADGGDQPALDALFSVQRRKLKVNAWLIRSERDGVVVTEEYRLTGDLPSRPVDDSGSRRLWLTAKGRGQFCFPEGLM